ncbi:MAG: Nitronate monooxygenase [Myxococcota bacterium]|nr:Nitronate monooxygenase [Myxococcota bacterium]
MNHRFHTRVCDLFGIRYPIVQGGMAWVSLAPLAAAVSNAGGLGVLGTSTMTPAEVRQNLDMMKDLTDKPFGVNISLISPTVEETVQIVIERKCPIVFTAAGNPKTYAKRLKQEAGCTLLHVTPSPRLAQKCLEAGVDGLVLEGWEAAGHISADEITSMALTPLVREFYDGPIIAAGGISTGRQMLAAMVLGADGIQMGTRFVAVKEGNSHPLYMELMTRQDPSYAKTAVYCKRYHPGRALKSPIVNRMVEMEMEGYSPQEIQALRGLRRAKFGCIDGDLNEGVFPAGMSSHFVKRVMTCQEVIDEIIGEAERELARVSAWMSRPTAARDAAENAQAAE